MHSISYLVPSFDIHNKFWAFFLYLHSSGKQFVEAIIKAHSQCLLLFSLHKDHFICPDYSEGRDISFLIFLNLLPSFLDDA